MSGDPTIDNTDSMVQFDDELVKAAESAAAENGHSVEDQINLWVRAGRDWEATLDFDSADVLRVLDGEAHYDNLNTVEQSIVRAIWEGKAEQRRQTLNLAEEFQAQGRSYSEYVDGEVVVHRPSDNQ